MSLRGDAFLPKQSPVMRGLLRRKEQVPASQRRIFPRYFFSCQNITAAKTTISNSQIRLPTTQSVKPGISLNGSAPDLTSLKILNNSRMIFSFCFCSSLRGGHFRRGNLLHCETSQRKRRLLRVKSKSALTTTFLIVHCRINILSLTIRSSPSRTIRFTSSAPIK